MSTIVDKHDGTVFLSRVHLGRMKLVHVTRECFSLGKEEDDGWIHSKHLRDEGAVDVLKFQGPLHGQCEPDLGDVDVFLPAPGQRLLPQDRQKINEALAEAGAEFRVVLPGSEMVDRWVLLQQLVIGVSQYVKDILGRDGLACGILPVNQV